MNDYRIVGTSSNRGINRQAQRYLEAGRELAEAAGEILGEANCINGLGQIKIKENDVTAGLDMLKDAVEMYNRINDRYSVADAYKEYAGLLAEKAVYRNKARELFLQAADIFAAIDMPKDAEKCLRSEEELEPGT